MATRACGNPMAAVAKFHANLLKVSHIEQYVVGHRCFAPGMQPANGSQSPSAALAQDFQEFVVIPRREYVFRPKRPISAKIGDRVRIHSFVLRVVFGSLDKQSRARRISHVRANLPTSRLLQQALRISNSLLAHSSQRVSYCVIGVYDHIFWKAPPCVVCKRDGQVEAIQIAFCLSGGRP